jgi:hypothetical protein
MSYPVTYLPNGEKKFLGVVQNSLGLRGFVGLKFGLGQEFCLGEEYYMLKIH